MDVAHIPHLHKNRSGIFEYRRAIPPALRKHFNKTEIVRSLRTRDPSVAKEVISSVAIMVQAEFEAARKGLAIPAITTAISQIRSWLDIIEVDHFSYWRRGPQPPFNDDEQILESLQAYIDSQMILRDPQVLNLMRTLAPGEYRRSAAMKEHLTSDENVLKGQPVFALPQHFGGVSPARIPKFETRIVQLPQSPSGRSSTMMSEVLRMYFKQRRLPSRTEHEWRLAWRRFMEVHGDMRIREITRDHLRAVVDLVMEFPKSIGRKERNLPLPQVIDRYRRKPKYQTVSVATVEKFVSALRSVLFWAEGNYIDVSPADKLSLKAKPSEAEVTERKSFSTDDLNLIFRTGVYDPSRKLTRSEYLSGEFWLPLIALYSGARLEEIGQLQVADLKMSMGTYYFDISTEVDKDEVDDPNLEKRLKNKSSKRMLPIHPVLEELGLLRLASTRAKSGESRLFPELKKDYHNSYTQAFSRDWNRQLRRIIKSKRKVFHSFRHLWKQRSGDCELDWKCAERLQGHIIPGVGPKYGEGIKISKLHAEMSKINFPGLDISHLLKAANRFLKPK